MLAPRRRRAGRTTAAGSSADRAAALPPKAKSVIWLFMGGGMSHWRASTPSRLDKYAGKTIEETPYKDVQDPQQLKKVRVVVVDDANGHQRNDALSDASRLQKAARAASRSATGGRTSAQCVDDMAVVRSMWTTDNDHGAQIQFHTGRHVLDGDFPTHRLLGPLRPGLAERQPAAVRRAGHAADCCGASATAHYLGPEYDGVPLRVDPNNPLPSPRRNGRHRRRAAERVRPLRRTEPAGGGRVSGRRSVRRGSSPTSWPSGCRRRCPR